MVLKACFAALRDACLAPGGPPQGRELWDHLFAANREWGLSLRECYWYLWCLANLFVWSISIAGAYNSSVEIQQMTNTTDDDAEGNEDFRVSSIASIYMILALIIGYHGVKFNALSVQEYNQNLLPRSKLAFSCMNHRRGRNLVNDSESTSSAAADADDAVEPKRRSRSV